MPDMRYSPDDPKFANDLSFMTDADWERRAESWNARLRRLSEAGRQRAAEGRRASKDGA